MLKAVLLLLPHSTLSLHIGVTKVFLRYTEHPPDAQHGWDLPPAVLVPLAPLPSHSNSSMSSSTLHSYAPDVPHTHAQCIYTPALLIDLMTLDSSMPYKVIIFSCGIVVFIFGSVFNLLSMRFVVLELEK
ncbi:GPI transamidase component PIG-T [Mycena rosella]|uniref:GPI transamidase component PIG-T n=1 Tax=Mycena rosella TaxID=1033263 RepID=A0AAD7DAI0_MYCRO|nr:GPI transamidase component PIG-T [Mycena rosella]